MSREPTERPVLLVVAGVIIERGRVLVTQRPEGTHLAGTWEFPGGKVERDEDPRDALARELHEELGIRVEVGEVLEVVFHRYPEKSVLLLFYEARRAPGSPVPEPLGVSGIAWRTAAEIVEADFPPADVEALAKVRRRLQPSRSGKRIRGSSRLRR